VSRTSAPLSRLGKFRSRLSVAVDDPLRQQIANIRVRTRLVNAKQIVEANILADDDDQMLDRGRRLRSCRGGQGQKHHQGER
jgi:hypothetical protein